LQKELGMYLKKWRRLCHWKFFDAWNGVLL